MTIAHVFGLGPYILSRGVDPNRLAQTADMVEESHESFVIIGQVGSHLNPGLAFVRIVFEPFQQFPGPAAHHGLTAGDPQLLERAMQIRVPPFEKCIGIDVFFRVMEQLELITGTDVVIPAVGMQALVRSIFADVLGPGTRYGAIAVGAGHLAGAIERYLEITGIEIIFVALLERSGQFFWTELIALPRTIAHIVGIEIFHDPTELAAQGPLALLHHPAFLFLLLGIVQGAEVGSDGLGIDLMCGIVEATGSST